MRADVNVIVHKPGSVPRTRCYEIKEREFGPLRYAGGRAARRQDRGLEEGEVMR